MAAPVAELIKYFVEHVPGAGRTQIVKLLYLADHEARRYLGRPLTDLQYQWYQFGPFDKRILLELERLRDQGFVEEERVTFFSGSEGYRYKNAPRPMPLSVPTEEAAILNYVAVEFGSTPLRDLLEDVVYQTTPMVDAKDRNAFGQPLRMELVDNQCRMPGLELDRVWRSVEQLNRGEGRPFREVMDELRGHHLTRSG